MRETKLSRFPAMALSFVLLLSLLAGCKKDAGSDNNSSGYYLTANVDGKSWAANVNSSLNNSPTIAAVTSSGGVSVLFLVGINAVNKDSTAIVVVFPQNAELNKSISF